MHIAEHTIWIITAVIFAISYFAIAYKAGFLPLVDPKSGRAAWEVKNDKIIPFSITSAIAIGVFYILIYVLLDSAENKGVFVSPTFRECNICFDALGIIKDPIRIKDKKELRNILDEGDWKVPK